MQFFIISQRPSNQKGSVQEGPGHALGHHPGRNGVTNPIVCHALHHLTAHHYFHHKYYRYLIMSIEIILERVQTYRVPPTLGALIEGPNYGWKRIPSGRL